MRHRSIRRIAAGILAAAAGVAAPASSQSEQERYALPPRTVEDVVRALDQYRQDPAVGARARAATRAQPPETKDARTLFEFYLERGRAAVQIGAARQGIEDLRKAVEYGGVGQYDEFSRAVQELANAEMSYGNWLAALRDYEEVLRISLPSLGGQRLGALGNIAFGLAQLGDVQGARQALARAEKLFASFRNGRNFETFRTNWTASIERARGNVLQVEGKLAGAEDALRRALRANQEDQEVNKRRLALRLSTPPQASVERFEILISGQLAIALRLEGKLAESEQLARAAIDTLERSGIAPEGLALASSRKVLGWALSAQEKWPDAVAAFEAMRAGVQADPNLAQRFGGS